mmetsp:Transcript_9243/g.19393  ORF Transcript_9243/g.19393 Transcript_9243/m.19393 type:complete len:211 (+) Transcript_9243:530-1162(+)
MGGETQNLRLVGSLEFVVQGVAKNGIRQLGLGVTGKLGSFHGHAASFLGSSEHTVCLLLGQTGSLESGLGRPFSSDRGVLNDPGVTAGTVGRFLEQRKELPRDQKVREMVRLHLHVVSVPGDRVGNRHDTGIVAQAIQTLRSVLVVPDFVAGPAAGREILEIAIDRDKGPVGNGFLQFLEGVLGPFRGTVQQKDGSIVIGNGSGGDEPRS